MRGAFKRSTALKRCTRAHSEVCTRTLHDRRASCRLRRTNSNAAACSLSTPRGAGLSPCTERHSAGHAKQRAAWPRWPEEPLAQLSWASSPRTAGAVARRHLRPGMSVARASPSRCCRTFVARGSAALLDKRLLSGEVRATTRLWSQMPVCDYWQCMVAQIAQVWRRAPKQSRHPNHPALLDLGALLLRQHRGAAPAAARRQ